MIETFTVTIPHLTKDKERRVFVYLPVQYDDERRFPVMYMFDGHNLFDDEDSTFGKSWGLADYLDYTDTPLIVVGVECNHDGNSRLEEYTPISFDDDGTFIKAKGKKYMQWLVKKLKPYIDENYMTLPDRQNTAIGGSSMGGLMTLYALSKYNKYFSKGAALSPSLWVGGDKVLPFIEDGKFPKDTVLYTDYGSKEFSNHRTQRKLFTQTVSTLLEKEIMLTARIVPGGTHSEESWERQIPIFMEALGFTPED